MVANFYEVDKNTVEVLISRNRDELERDRMKVLTGRELREAKKGYLQGVSNLKIRTRINYYLPQGHSPHRYVA